MDKFVSINIDKKDCKGLYLYCDTESKSINTADEATKLIGIIFKLQLKTRVEGKLFKKTFSFNKNKKSFIKALEYVASQRDELREKIKIDGTVREIKSNEENTKVKKITFLNAVEEYLQLKEVSLRARTLVCYETALLNHCKELHNREITTITTSDIQKVVNTLIGRGRQPGTIKTFVMTIKGFFTVASDKYDTKVNLKKLELPAVDNKVEYKLSLEDTRKIIKVLREYSKIDLGKGEVFYQFEEMKNIFAFSLTGRRISEILSLEFSNFNLDNNSYFIASADTKGKKKLDFVLDEYLLQALKSQARLRKVDFDSKSDVKLFTYNRESARKHFQNLLNSLNLPRLRLHDIRHMLGTTLVQNGVPIQDISRMLGHSSILITEQRYAKTNKEQANRATTAFNKLMEV